jgi:hypothetical protein
LKGTVPYFKCVPCKVRVSATGADTAVSDRPCPSCGMPLESVADLTEVVGFRVAEPVADASGRRPATEEEVEIDRWLDEGGRDEPEQLGKAVVRELPV